LAQQGLAQQGLAQQGLAMAGLAGLFPCPPCPAARWPLYAAPTAPLGNGGAVAAKAVADAT